MTPLFKKTVWLLFAVSVCAFAGSLAAQYVLGMDPCVLCISQRLCVLATGLCAAIVLACKPKGRVGGLSGAVFISIPAVTGAAVAAYQLWLQSLPPGTAPSCGAPWTFRLKGWPLFDWCAGSEIVPNQIICWGSLCLFGVRRIFWRLSWWFGGRG